MFTLTASCNGPGTASQGVTRLAAMLPTGPGTPHIVYGHTYRVLQLLASLENPSQCRDVGMQISVMKRPRSNSIAVVSVRAERTNSIRAATVLTSSAQIPMACLVEWMGALTSDRRSCCWRQYRTHQLPLLSPLHQQILPF